MAKEQQTQGRRQGVPLQGTPIFASPRPESGSIPRRSPPERRREQPPAPVPIEEAQVEQLQVQGLYIISVAARILEMHPQTLRKYERLGLVQPSRTVGMLRLYSQEDIEKLRLIKHLVEELGLNLAGVEVALHVFQRLLAMRRRMLIEMEAEAMRQALAQEMEALFRLLDLPEP